MATCSKCRGKYDALLSKSYSYYVANSGDILAPPYNYLCDGCYRPASSKKEEEMEPIKSLDGFTFGCDPELFVRDTEGNLVTAEGLIPGTKDVPYKVEFGAVQVDGMAAEFNIDPVSNFEDWNRNIKEVIRQLRGMLPKGYSLDAIPTAKFSQEAFDKAPDCAKELGCSPDFNAWTGEINPPPADPENPTMRSAAGHIHIGWTSGAQMDDLQHIMNCRDLVKQMDWYLGHWSSKLDNDPSRRRLYGRAGACRYKDYGVEYRVLSNFWVMEKDRRLLVWNRMQKAISDMKESFMPDQYPKGYSDMIVEAINSTTRNSTLEREFRYPLMSVA